jgi:hypothetical protein
LATLVVPSIIPNNPAKKKAPRKLKMIVRSVTNPATRANPPAYFRVLFISTKLMQ